jgi:ribosome-associated heat shock protein Hsp15
MPPERMRIDKWLWAARFYKTRSLATDEVGKGRVHINGQEAKPSREVKAGDVVWLRGLDLPRTVTVRGLNDQRGPAPAAQLLYEETTASLQARLATIEQRRIAPEPAHTITHGRPSKRDRRDLEDNKANAARSWDDRWSASTAG